MPSSAYDLGYLKVAADLLERYLLSKDTYWKVNAMSPIGEPPYPSLTLSSMLLSQCRLNSRQLDVKEAEQLARLNTEIDRISSTWRTAWENKTRGEFRLRLNLWRDFLEDFRADPGANIDRYSYEISRRVMLQLLSGEAKEIPEAEQQMLSGLDAILSAIFEPGDFIWDTDLRPGFPKSEYPYLYGNLRI
jgi:hypothetical protein